MPTLSPAFKVVVLGSSLDADAKTFCGNSGATDVAAVSAFVKGLKAAGLWNSIICWPMVSSQNAGTGTTAYSLGGLETNNGTLVNGPTWGTTGIATSSTAYVKANYSRTVTATPLTVFGAYTGLTPVLNQTYVGLGNTTLGNPLIWLGAWNGGSVTMRGFTRNTAGTDVTPVVGFLSANGTAQTLDNVTAVPSSGLLVRSNAWLGTEGAIGIDNIACGGGLRTTFGNSGPATYAIFGYMTVQLSDAQIAAFYSLYKSTLGASLGLP